MIGAIVALLVGWVAVRAVLQGMHAQATGADIRMSHPRFMGRDESGQPFTINAEVAVRDARDGDLIALTRPDMLLYAKGKTAPGRLRGDRGLYNEGSHVLAVEGNVVFEDGGGYRFNSDLARIDTFTREVEGRSRVTGDGPIGHTRAQAYAIHDRGGRMVFIGDVHTHLNNDKGSPAAR